MLSRHSTLDTRHSTLDTKKLDLNRSRKWSGFLVVVCVLFFALGCAKKELDLPEVSSSTISGKLSGFSSSSSLGLADSSNSSAQAAGVNLSQSLVTAMSCSSATASLYKLDSSGTRVEPALATCALGSDGSFSFNSKTAGVSFSSSVPSETLIVSVSGCTSGVYSRPITGAKDQHVTMGSTVLSYLLNTDNKSKVYSALKNSPANFNSLIATLDSATTLADAYSLLSSNSAITSRFTNLFGVAPTTLDQASPEVVSNTLPSAASELVSAHLAVSVSHFSSSYNVVYAWKLDGTLIGTQADWQWTPTANMQGTHTLSLTIGESDGSGNVDTTKPVKTLSQALTITNNVLPTAPSFSITTPSVVGTTPINTRALTLTINTGGSKANCATFSNLALTENDSATPASTAFTISCTQDGTQTLSYTLASSGDGLKTLRLWAIDASGTISSVASSTFAYLDTGSPTMTIATTPSALSNNASQTFSFAATDNGGVIDHYECKMDGGSYAACSTPKSYSSLSEADHTFYVKAFDTAGNASNVDSKTWHIDLTAPTLSVSGSPNAITNQLTATFSFSASDSGGGTVASLSCNLDSAGYASCASPFINVLSAGAHTLLIKATDTAGNISSVQSFSWTIDTSLPTVTIASKPASLTNSTSASFTFSGTDTGGGSVASYECNLDSAGYSACTSVKTYTGLSAAAHAIAIRAIDTAGNIGSATSYNWTIDLTTPLASINSGPDSLTNSTSASFTFSANPPPAGSITGYECDIDSAGFASCTSPKSYASLAQGSHTFQVRSIDNNGNRSTAVSQTWTVDTTAPMLTINSNPTSLNNSTSASFTFSATDSGGGSVASYACKLDGASYASCSSPISYSSLAQGSHTFYVTVTDSAGNTSSAQTNTWTTDLTAPAITISANPTAITNSSSANFTFSAADSGGGAVSSYQCSIDGAAYATCTSIKSYTGLSTGSHQFALIAIDSAGNTSSASTYSWTIDTTAPTISITSTPSSPTNATTASFSFSATDSGGGAVASYACKIDAGSYTSCTSPTSYSSLAAGAHTFYITSTDTAGNTSSASSVSWTVDLTAPTVAITTPAASAVVLTSNIASYAMSGTCSENGQTVTIAGSISATATCASGAWSATVDLSGLADGTLSITATQSDAAGNSTTTASRSFIKDTTAPTLTLSSLNSGIYAGNKIQNISFSLADANLTATPVALSYSTDGGSTWTSIIAAVANVSPYAWSVPVINSTTVKIKIVATDIAGNQSMVISSSNLSFDSSVPVISSLVINGGVATTSSNSIPVNLTASSSTGTANISYFCLKYNDSSAPTASDSCWVLLSRNDVNVTPATSISFSNFYFSVGFSSITYTVYAWVMDEVQQISASANAAVTLQPGSPPVVSSILVSNHDSPTIPLTSSDTSFAYHSDVYIYWNVSDAEGLAANQVKIEYTLDDTTWTTIASSLSETSQTGCNLVAGANGCYKWSGGAPTDDGSGTPGTTADDKSFKIRITGVDTSGMVSSGTSVNVNTGSLSLIAGNTNPGLNGSSSSAVFFSYSTNNNPSNAVFTITSKGELFFLDYLRGLIYVSPTDGIQTLLLATNNSFGTENGPVATASLKLPYKIGMDNLNNIYVFDYDRIRKINTSVSPMTITTIIGGGASNGLTTVSGLNFQLTSTSYTTALSGAVFHVLGNGDIWFSSENYDGLQTSIRKRIRFYNHTDGNVYSYNVSGTGNSVSGTIDMTATDTFIQKWAVAYDPNSFLTTKFMVTSLRSTTTQSLWGLSVIDTSTWTVSGTHPTGLSTYHYTSGYYYTGLDGNIYLIDYDSTKIIKYNLASNTFSTIYGTASKGYCPANTTATSCNALLAGIFVNKQGKVYVVDNNIVRTIDEAGKVQDVFGQMQSYGENTLATNARFKEVSAIGAWYDTSVNKTKIIISDRYGFKIKESTVGGNINTIAGSGLQNAIPTKSIDATTTPLATEGVNGSSNYIHMFVDPVNGNVYKGQSSNLNYVLQRGTPNHWENMITTGAGPFTNMDSDSLIGSPIAAGNVTWGNYSSTFFMGMNANSILMLDHDYDSAASQHRGGALLEYNRSSVTIEKIGGKYGQPSSSFSLCADGTLATSCITFYSLLYSGAGYTHAEYDAYLDSWIFGIIGTNAIRILKKGTNLSTLVNVASGVRSIAYVRVGGASPTKRKLWYCNSSGVLKEYDLLTSTETALSWKISNMTCNTNYLIYSSERNSLIFPVTQNNLAGVAEYLLP